MARFFVRPADLTDNESLCRLSQVPMDGQISLALERLPDFFAGAKVQNESVEVNLCCDRHKGEQIVAVFSIGRRQVFLGGQVRWVRYLSDVRILPAYRGYAPLAMINHHIRSKEDRQSSETVQSVIFSDNIAMREMIRRRSPKSLRRMQRLWFYDLGGYRTSAISLAAKARSHRYRYDIRRATAGDSSSMQAFFDEEARNKEFYPAYDFSRLADPYYTALEIGDFYLAFDKGTLVGITGIWDQQSFKQIRIAAYNGALRWFRPILNVASQHLTGFSLPPPGTTLSCFYLHTIVTQGNSPVIFRDLVERIYAEYRGGSYAYFVCGLFEHDPLSQVIDSLDSRRDIRGRHYQVAAREIGDVLRPDQPMYLEAARI